uniref:Reverse transcriptase domain-containing protein n=1 Tax=Tanacetum cinerariifolium TaxID=118510 RepID=A0A6L2KU42_TANCI|nr:hypothetical protein [Tanacetum cinerariifolium]
MSTRSSARNLFPPLDNPDLTIRRRSRVDPTLLNNFEMATNGNGDPPVLDLRTMEELCQPTLNGRGGPIAPIAIQATNMLRVTQIDTFYNGLTLRHRDTINVAAGGNIMKRRPEECYDLIEYMTAHYNEWDTSIQRTSHGQNPPPAYQAPAYQASGYQALVHQALIPQPQVVTTTEFTKYMKANDAILKNMQTNMISLKNSNLELKNMFGQFMKINTASSSGSRTLPSNIITNPKEDLKGITTRSGNAYKGPTIPTTYSPPKVVERKTEVTKDMVPPTINKSTKDVQPPVVHVETPIPNSKPVEAPFGPTIKSLLTNKEKLFELARTSLNEHYSVVLLNKLLKKLGDPGKFLIPCDFPIMDECLALVDLGTSIILMPLSVWNKLSLPELSPTYMTLELADRFSRPVGVVEDVFVKVETFHFPADFVVVDFDADPRVLLILGRSFLKTGHALIDVYEGELTLRVGKEAVTFNLNQNSRYLANYDVMSVNRIVLIDIACGDDFLLEETDAFLAIDAVPISPDINEAYYDSEGDILLFEKFLNDDPSSPPLPPQVLKVVEPTNEKSSIDEPPVDELKDLPPHLKYAFLEGDDILPVIIAKDLKMRRKPLS